MYYKNFGKVYLENANYDLDDKELLYEAGAIDRDRQLVTFSIMQVFCSSQGVLNDSLPWAYIRLMRFEANSAMKWNRVGLPTFDQKFEGSIIQQIRKIRSFLGNLVSLKPIRRRNPNGGFIEDPEFPHIAVDESIVNAVAHRDYGTQIPIECIHYKDAFVVGKFRTHSSERSRSSQSVLSARHDIRFYAS